MIYPLKEFPCAFSLGITVLDGSLQVKDKGQIRGSLIKIRKASSRVPSWVVYLDQFVVLCRRNLSGVTSDHVWPVSWFLKRQPEGEAAVLGWQLNLPKKARVRAPAWPAGDAHAPWTPGRGVRAAGSGAAHAGAWEPFPGGEGAVPPGRGGAARGPTSNLSRGSGRGSPMPATH